MKTSPELELGDSGKSPHEVHLEDYLHCAGVSFDKRVK
jgi:hypothetical protein